MPFQWTTVDVGSQQMWAYLSIPDSPGPHPGVAVIQTAAGVDYWLQGMCRRLSDAGYVAIAPDLYHRVDPNEISPDTWRDRRGPIYYPRTRMATLLDEQILMDVNAAIDHLKAHPSVRGNRIGITGFCLGGRVAYLMASSSPALRLAAPFYPSDVLESWGDGLSPFDRTSTIHCPVVGFFGDDDVNPSPEVVSKLDVELSQHSKFHEFFSYPETGHAFQWDVTEKYRPEAARDSWDKLLAQFHKYLGD